MNSETFYTCMQACMYQLVNLTCADIEYLHLSSGNPHDNIFYYDDHKL